MVSGGALDTPELYGNAVRERGVLAWLRGWYDAPRPEKRRGEHVIEELFHIGPLSISPFGVMMMLAVLAAYWQLYKGLTSRGAGSEEDASAILLAAGVGGVVGAKLYYAALYRDASLLLSRAGLVWYGGLLLGAVAVLLTVRMRKLPLVQVADAAALGLALGYAVGRIGCFLVGDDYGVPTDLPWGVAFAVGVPPTTVAAMERAFGMQLEGDPNQILRVHPTQLYETLLAGSIWLWGRNRFRQWTPGRTAIAVLGLLALERFAVEFLRAKDDRFFGVLTLAQVISLVIIVILIALWRKSGSDDHAEAHG